MNSEEQQFQRQQIADFRYSVVAELCNSYLSAEERQQLIMEKTARRYTIPGSVKTTITASSDHSTLNLIV